MATLVLHHQTSPAQDAEALHQAFKGFSSINLYIILIVLVLTVLCFMFLTINEHKFI